MADQAANSSFKNMPGQKIINDKVRMALEKNCRLLKQHNSELILRNAMLGKIIEIARGVDSVRTENGVYNLVVESARDIPGIRFVLVFRLSDDKNEFVLTCHSRIRNSNIAMGLKFLGFDLNQQLNLDLAGQKYRFPVSGIPGAFGFVNNPAHFRFERLSQLLDDHWGRRLCDAVQGLLSIEKFSVVPLAIDSTLWGVLLFFMDKDIPADILEMIGDHCNIALKNVCTLKKLEKHHLEISTINNIAVSISGSLEMRKIISQTINGMRDIFSAKGVAVYLLDETGRYLNLAGQFGMSDQIQEHSHQLALSHPFAQLISSNDLTFSGNLHKNLDRYPGVFCPSGDGVTGWFMNAVLTFGGKRAGIITIMRPGCEDFDDEEKSLLLSISSQLSIALDNASLHQKLISRIRDLDSTRGRLSQSEEKMRLTLESISDGVMVIALDGGILQSNSMAVKIFGYDEDNGFTQKNALRYVVPDDRRRLLEHLRSVFSRRAYREATYSLIKKDGSLFPAECNIGTYQNSQGEIEGFVICIRDISERKIAELRLQESERQYRLIAENTNDYISMLTFSGYYSYVSPSYRQLGYEPEELINSFALNQIHEDDHNNILPVLLKFSQMDHDDITRMKNVSYSQRLEYRLRDNYGKWHDILAASNIIESLDGKGYDILVIGHDITDLKQAEIQLKRSYDNEKKAREALEHQINKRADFFRALVHELKTPLTPIIVSSETIMELVENDTFKNLASNVYHSAMRLNERVEELLDISRGEMGMLKVHLEPINMILVIENVASYQRTQMDRNHQRLLLNLPEDLPQVRGDENRLRQILLNLVGNAIKFTPDGGLISISAEADKENLTIIVQDTGKGIDDEDLDRLFQPYNRIESDRQNFSGLGLGLALCKQLIELHGGKIWVHSLKGKGTTFGFSLPVLASAAPPATPPSSLETVLKEPQ